MTEYPELILEGWRLWDWLVAEESESKRAELAAKATNAALEKAAAIGSHYPGTGSAGIFYARRRVAIHREQRTRRQ